MTQLVPNPPREEQVIDVGAVWREIEATVRELNLDESKVLPGGASSEDFAALEKEIGVVFPGSFKQCYLLHNGSNRITVCPNAFFLPLLAKEGWHILDSWRSQLDMAEAMKGEDLPYPEGPIRRAHWHPKWVPFTWDEQANYTCLDFAPKKEGIVGQVIYVSRDYGPERVLADTFAQWFDRQPRELRAWHEKVQRGDWTR